MKTITSLFTNETLGISQEVTFLEGDLSVANLNGVPKLTNYGEGLAKLLKDILTPESVCVDAGAHIGLTSLIMKHAGARRVISFEPSRKTFELLFINATGIGLRNAALSNSTGAMQFRWKGTFSGGSHLALPHHQDPEEVEETVAAVIGDMALLDLKRLDFLKIDVEGSEMQALDGLRHTIGFLGPVILIEINPLTARDVGQFNLVDLYRWFDCLKPRLTFLFDQNTAETRYIANESEFMRMCGDDTVRDMLVVPL